MDLIFPTFNYTSGQFVRFKMSNNYPGQYKKAFEEFIQFYAPDLVVTQAKKKRRLISKESRVCRFCKKAFPEVSFKNDAHVIPQFLGNKYLVHDIECDNCNLKFGRYETSFADSIGLFRTTDYMKGQRGVPKFKNDGLVAYSEKDEVGNEAIVIETNKLNKAEFDKENKTVKFSTVKNAFIPLHVMKSLFKIGYSLLNENELNEYQHIEKIINTSDLDNKLQDHCKVLKFTFENQQPHPIVISFRKKIEYKEKNIPSKIILLYFGRFMYEFILLNSTDNFMIKKGGQGNVMYIPPYWDEKQNPPTAKIIDFSSPEKKIEEESFVFTFNTND